MHNCEIFPMNFNKTFQLQKFSTINDLHYTVTVYQGVQVVDNTFYERQVVLHLTHQLIFVCLQHKECMAIVFENSYSGYHQMSFGLNNACVLSFRALQQNIVLHTKWLEECRRSQMQIDHYSFYASKEWVWFKYIYS